jgi:hypothetical protein
VALSSAGNALQALKVASLDGPLQWGSDKDKKPRRGARYMNDRKRWTIVHAALQEFRWRFGHCNSQMVMAPMSRSREDGREEYRAWNRCQGVGRF